MEFIMATETTKKYTKTELESLDQIKLRSVAKAAGVEYAGVKPAKIIADILAKQGGTPAAKTEIKPAAAKAGAKGKATPPPAPEPEPEVEEEEVEETGVVTREEFDALVARIEALEAKVAEGGGAGEGEDVEIGPEDVANMDLATVRKACRDFGIEFRATETVEALRTRLLTYMEENAGGEVETPAEEETEEGGEEEAEYGNPDDYERPAILEGVENITAKQCVKGFECAVWAPYRPGFDESVQKCVVRTTGKTDDGETYVTIYTPHDNSEADVDIADLFPASVLAPKKRPPVPGKKSAK